MRQKANGSVSIVYLPGTGSLIARSLHIYRQLFPQLVTLTGYLAIAGLANLFIGEFFGSFGEGQQQLVKVLVGLVNFIVFLVFGFLYSYYFAAASHLIAEWYSRGRTLSLKQAFALSRERFASLYWVAVLIGLIVYSSTFTGILPILFGVWYYFAVNIVLFESEKGIEALAKSRYLLHGLFGKVFGRYIAIIGIYSAVIVLLYNLFLGLPGGWILTLFLLFILLYFSFPFFVAYGYLQYHDTSAVERVTAFEFFRGEKVAIAFWFVLGCVMIAGSVFIGLLSDQTRVRLFQAIDAKSSQLLLQFVANSENNLQKMSSILRTLGSGQENAPSNEENSQYIDN